MSIKDAKILIVEDEPQINRLIELVLQSGGYYDISKSYDGAEAYERIKKHAYDLILLDVMLPSVDGYTLCRKVKSDKRFSDTQIIMITAKKLEDEVIEGFESGAVDYISKPFSNKILLARVEARLKNRKTGNKVLSYNNISFDDSKKVVYVGNNKVDLTNFEYKILKIFLENAGIVFSRTDLLEYLRGEDGFNVSERAIDVQILNLRKKLKDIPECIETVRGVGYRLREIL